MFSTMGHKYKQCPSFKDMYSIPITDACRFLSCQSIEPHVDTCMYTFFILLHTKDSVYIHISGCVHLTLQLLTPIYVLWINVWVQHNCKWCVTNIFSAKLNTLRLRESERDNQNMMCTRLYLCATVVLMFNVSNHHTGPHVIQVRRNQQFAVPGVN